jgi:hypothetical protein
MDFDEYRCLSGGVVSAGSDLKLQRPTPRDRIGRRRVEICAARLRAYGDCGSVCALRRTETERETERTATRRGQRAEGRGERCRQAPSRARGSVWRAGQHRSRSRGRSRRPAQTAARSACTPQPHRCTRPLAAEACSAAWPAARFLAETGLRRRRF